MPFRKDLDLNIRLHNLFIHTNFFSWKSSSYSKYLRYLFRAYYRFIILTCWKPPEAYSPYPSRWEVSKSKKSASHHLIYVKIVRILIPDGFRSYFSTLFDDLKNHHVEPPCSWRLACRVFTLSRKDMKLKIRLQKALMLKKLYHLLKSNDIQNLIEKFCEN